MRTFEGKDRKILAAGILIFAACISVCCYGASECVMDLCHIFPFYVCLRP